MDAKLRLSTGDSVEIDSGASVSPDSNQFSTRSSSTSSTVVERKLKQQPPAAAPTAAVPSPRVANLPEKLAGAGAGGDADSLGDEEDEDDEEARVAGRLEADTISDESGYSEESSNAKAAAAAAAAAGGRGSNVPRTRETHSGMKTIVLLNASSVSEGEDDCDRRGGEGRRAQPIPAPRAMTPRTPRAASSPGSPASPIQCDLTVHSALISDFLDKTAKADGNGGGGGSGGIEKVDSPNVDFLPGRITEFCINI